MTDQQWTVVADRAKGDDPQWRDVQVGDRMVTIKLNAFDRRLVRIERPVPTTWVDEVPASERRSAIQARSYESPRPVPTTDKPSEVAAFLAWSNMDASSISNPREAFLAGVRWASPHPSTREQIAEALYDADALRSRSWSDMREGGVARTHYLELADAVLALIQNGADR